MSNEGEAAFGVLRSEAESWVTAAEDQAPAAS